MKLRDKDYINRVLTILNENDVEQAYSASRVRSYIEQLYPQVWRRAVSTFPVSWFYGKQYQRNPVFFWIDVKDIGDYQIPTDLPIEACKVLGTWKEPNTRHGGVLYEYHGYRKIDSSQGVGYIALPTDYLKLSRFKIKGWRTGVTQAHTQSPEVDFKQSNRYTRGTPWRPICVEREAEIYLAFGVDNSQVVTPRVCTDVQESRSQLLQKCGVTNVAIESSKLERSVVQVLSYYSLPPDAPMAEHRIEDFRYIPRVAQLPEVQDIRDILLEPLIHLGAVVTLEGLELWEEANIMKQVLYGEIVKQV